MERNRLLGSVFVPEKTDADRVFEERLAPRQLTNLGIREAEVFAGFDDVSVGDAGMVDLSVVGEDRWRAPVDARGRADHCGVTGRRLRQTNLILETNLNNYQKAKNSKTSQHWLSKEQCCQPQSCSQEEELLGAICFGILSKNS